jgi:hypothetical protein
LNIQKCANIPIVNSGNQVVYRTNFNTEILIANPISIYSGANGCFVSTVMRKQGATFTNSLANTFDSNGLTTILILNNWRDESYFGASKTNLTATNWSAQNRFIGGVLKKIQVQPSTVIRTYDSRSTTTSQKSTFSETTTDFLTGTGTTNLLLHSEAVDNAAWEKGLITVTANSTAAPDGTMTADRLVETTGTGQHRTSNVSSIAVTSGVAYTYSFFAKADQRTFVHARINTVATNAQACFDLSAGTSIQSAGTTATITNVGNGWFRCSISAVTNGRAATCFANLATSSSLTVPSYAGSTAQGLFLWGQQLQEGTAVTQYLPTTTSRADGYFTTESDATTGRASIVCVGAIATGGSVAITRFTGQRFTLQRFGFRVQVETPDMTFGDDDLSAFSPITMAVQAGITRTQAAIAAATTITSFQDQMEELHVLAIGLQGAASYNAFGGGNLFTFEGGRLTTNFAAVNVDPSAASKISFDSTTNVLTVRSTTLVGNSTVSEWVNASGPINLLNGAVIQGLYTSSAGPNSIVQLKNVTPAAVAAVWHPTTTATELYQVNNTGSAADYTLYYPPGSVGLVKRYARELYGTQRSAGSITLAAGLNVVEFIDIPDVGITNTSASAVAAYLGIEGPSRRYDRTAILRLTEQGIKLGQIATRSGTSIEGTFSVVVRDDAPAVMSVLGNVITIKAASYDADAKFIKEIVTGGGTFTAFDTELIGIDVEDANGDSSVSVQGTVGGLVDVWKCVNGTVNADYETGTKIASNISAGKFRFTGTDGFKLIFYDKSSLLARDCSMSKGNYVLGWYVYDQATGGLTQSQNADFATMVSKVSDIFADVNSVTTGFVEATDNLHALRVAVDTKPTLGEIEASTVLAKVTDTLNANIVQVNEVPVSGTGVEGDEWGPEGYAP